MYRFGQPVSLISMLDHTKTNGETAINFKNINLYRFILLIFPFLLILQNPGLKDYFEIESGPKIYHYFLPFFIGAFLLRSRGKKMGLVYLLTFFAVISTITSGQLRMQFLSFLLFVFTCIAASGVSDENDEWFRKGCLIAIGAIFLNILLHIPEIISSGAQNAEERAIYPTLMAAGVNIELSTLVLLLIYAMPKSIGLISIATLLLYYVFKTRTIVIIWLIYMAFVYRDILKAALIRHGRLLVFAAVVISIGGLITLIEMEIISVERLVQIGRDPGSIGRLMLYEVAFTSSECFSTGCGIGSAQEIIQNTRVADFFEDNFHNVYLQILVEMGVLGLFSYVLLMINAIKSAKKKHDIGLYVCLLSIAMVNFIQFTGFEILTAYFIGRALRDSPSAINFNNSLHEQ